MSEALCHVVLLLLLCDWTLPARIKCKVPQGGVAIRYDSDSANDGQIDSSIGVIGEIDIRSGVHMPPSEDESKSIYEDNEDTPSQHYLKTGAVTIEKKQPRRQKTFFRNPNYISANKVFDTQAKFMYPLDLPRPHPGGLPGSTNGCEEHDSQHRVRLSVVN